jgi:hypothetical protein
MNTVLTFSTCSYLNALFDYLYNFFRRAKPLFDLNELESKARQSFDEEWKQGKVPGWEEIETADQSLFCPACEKQFSKQTVYDAHLTGKKHIKAQKKLEGQNGNAEPREDKRKAIAWKETLISKYAEALSDFREESKSNVERKQALTDKERIVSNHDNRCHGNFTNQICCVDSWNKSKKRSRLLIKIQTKMTTKRFTILSNYHLAGMESLFLIGCTNYTVWEWNILARFVATMYIWVERHSISISRSGDMLMV